MRRVGLGQSGFTYLAVLFLVALTAAGLATLAEAWTTAAQREREVELGWRGEEIARAIASYARATPAPPLQYPRDLQDLMVDNRGPLPRHHLRRLYADPMTGASDWVLVSQAGQPGRFSAVRSRSDQPLLREVAKDGVVIRKASDWLFSAEGMPAAPPAVPSSAPSAPAPGAS